MGRTRRRLEGECEGTPAEGCFDRHSADIIVYNESEYEALIDVLESLDDMSMWTDPRNVAGYKANKRVLSELKEAYGEENEGD